MGRIQQVWFNYRHLIVYHSYYLVFQHFNDKQIPQNTSANEMLVSLTLLGSGVVFPKGIVFGNIWVQIAQWIFRNIFGRHHFVVANNIRESNS